MRIAVLGIGNVLLSDEGVGVRAAAALDSSHAFSPAVEFIDGGTMGLDLLPFIEGRERVLLIDAVDVGAAPGTIATLHGEEIPKYLSIKMSVHQIGLPEMLAAAKVMGILPPVMTLVGIQPGSLEPGLELSEAVRLRFPDLVSASLAALKEWGVEALPRPASPAVDGNGEFGICIGGAGACALPFPRA